MVSSYFFSSSLRQLCSTLLTYFTYFTYLLMYLFTLLSIHEISKLIMYQFYYDYLKPKYGDKCTLLFTDTDCFCCHIQTEDVNFLPLQQIFTESSPGILRTRQILLTQHILLTRPTTKCVLKNSLSLRTRVANLVCVCVFINKRKNTNCLSLSRLFRPRTHIKVI